MKDEYATYIDIVTGLPISPSDKAKDIENFGKLESNKGRGDQLQAALSSDPGQTLLNEIQETLMNRINTLVNEDAECKALKRLLVNMGVKLDLGKKASERLMRLVVK